MSNISKRKDVTGSAPPGARNISRAREPYPDSEAEGGKAYSALDAGEKHPNAFSSASGGSLSFGGSPPDWDRPFQKNLEEDAVNVGQVPWGSGVEDSRKLYPLPLFPAPLDPGTGKAAWTGKEEADFKESVKMWILPDADNFNTHDDIEGAAEHMWQQRYQKRTLYWLRWSSARGAYLMLESKLSVTDPKAYDKEVEAHMNKIRASQAEENLEGLEMFSGDNARLPQIVAFPVGSHPLEGRTTSSSISIYIGGGTGNKGQQRTDDVQASDRSTAGASWRLGGKKKCR